MVTELLEEQKLSASSHALVCHKMCWDRYAQVQIPIWSCSLLYYYGAEQIGHLTASAVQQQVASSQQLQGVCCSDTPVAAHYKLLCDLYMIR
jgi:hypothetical protein